MVDCLLTILVNQICRLFSIPQTPDSIITRGDIEAVKRQLIEFPEYKRGDLKKMLKASVAAHGRVLEL